MLLYLIGGENRDTISTLGNPATLFICVSALGAKVFCRWVVTPSMNFAASVSRWINVNYIAVVVQLLVRTLASCSSFITQR
jgi:hypothetical protein